MNMDDDDDDEFIDKRRCYRCEKRLGAGERMNVIECGIKKLYSEQRNLLSDDKRVREEFSRIDED